MKTTENKNTPSQKIEPRLSLSMEILNQSLTIRQKKEELLNLKITKEINELIQNLVELPQLYADEVMEIFESEEISEETFIEFFTEKISDELTKTTDKINNIIDKIVNESF